LLALVYEGAAVAGNDEVDVLSTGQIWHASRAGNITHAACSVVLIEQAGGVSHVINVVNQKAVNYFVCTQMDTIISLKSGLSGLSGLSVRLGRP
jgi:hypothetical protein